MHQRKIDDSERLLKMLGKQPKRYRPCGVYLKDGRPVRFWKSGYGTYRYFKKAARKALRRKMNGSLQKLSKNVYDLDWKYY